MNIDELRTVQTKERQKDSLQHLRDEFYEDVAGYIRDLKDERDRAADAADDPFSDPEVSRLTDEIETAEEVVEAIYERRVGKVVKLSSFAAADMPVDEEGLTAQERDLFEDLVTRIGDNKTRVLDILAGEGDAGRARSATGDDDAGPQDDAGDDAARDVAGEVDSVGGAEEVPAEESPDRSEPAFGTGSDQGSETTGDADRTTSGADRTTNDSEPAAPPDEPPSSRADEVVSAGQGAGDEESAVQESTPAVDPELAGRDADRTTVRVTADVGRVLGVDDREYDLKHDDVVDLPADNADALLQRDAAERLE